jgi:hypothetical protein
MSGFFSIA